MAKISPEVRKQITGISKTELEKIVIKLATKDKAVFDFLLVNHTSNHLDPIFALPGLI